MGQGMTDLIIRGKPLARFTFDYLPSWNEALDKARGKGGWRSGKAHTELWRNIGYELGQGFMREFRPYEDYLIKTQGLVVVKAFRAYIKSPRRYDSHNTYVKAVLDGFSDACIWVDDDIGHVPWVLFGGSYVKGGEQYFEVDVHELGRVLFETQDDDERMWDDG
jgi:hypothetical protein